MCEHITVLRMKPMIIKKEIRYVDAMNAEHTNKRSAANRAQPKYLLTFTWRLNIFHAVSIYGMLNSAYQAHQFVLIFFLHNFVVVLFCFYFILRSHQYAGEKYYFLQIFLTNCWNGLAAHSFLTMLWIDLTEPRTSFQTWEPIFNLKKTLLDEYFGKPYKIIVWLLWNFANINFQKRQFLTIEIKLTKSGVLSLHGSFQLWHSFWSILYE